MIFRFAILAFDFASFVVEVLNEIKIAFDAEARATSLSFINPTPECITLILILSLFMPSI